MKYRIFILAILLISKAAIAFDEDYLQYSLSAIQPPLPFLNKYKMQNEAITSIHLDKNNFLWIGTLSGIFKIKGQTAIKFTTNSNGKLNIPIGRFINLTSNDKGVVYALGIEGKIIKFKPEESKFKLIDAAFKTPEKEIPTYISSTKKNGLWVGTTHGITYYEDYKNNLLNTTITTNSGEEIGEVFSIRYNTENSIYFYSENGFFYAEKNQSKIQITNLGINIKNITTFFISKNEKEVIYIGTKQGEIFKIDKKNNKTSYVKLMHSPTLVSSIEEFINLIIIGTYDGLFVIPKDLQKKPIRLYKNKYPYNSHIASLEKIDDNHIFINGSLGLGLLNRHELLIIDRNIKRHIYDIDAIAKDHKNRIWLGTYHGLFYQSNNLTKEQKNTSSLSINNSKELILNTKITSLIKNDDKILIGTRDEGLKIIDLYSLDIKNSKLEKFHDAEIAKIFRSKNNKFFVATNNYGILEYIDGELYRPKVSKQEEVDILSKSSLFISESCNRDILFYGSDNNIYSYSQDKKKAVQLSKGKLHYIILNVNDFCDNRLWLGTLNSGLHVAEIKDNDFSNLEFKPANNEVRMQNLSIYAIETDSKNNLWLATSDGIYVLDKDGAFIKRFGEGSGIQSLDFNFGASYKDEDGRIYFGGVDGYNIFQPEEMDLEATPPQLILTDIKIAGKQAKLNTPLQQLSKLVLNYDDYYLNLEFSILDYVDQGGNHYRYKLEGFDSSWIDSGNYNIASYSNLPEGDYTFWVQGAGSSGIWNREGIKIHISVLPPPWRTWWAYSLYFMGLILILWHVKRSYDNHISRKNALKIAFETQLYADRAMDDAQAHIFEQNQLLEQLHQFNLKKIDLSKRSIQALSIKETTEKKFCESQERYLNIIEDIEKSLYFRHGELLVDINHFTNCLSDHLLNESLTEKKYTVTLINTTEEKLISTSPGLDIGFLIAICVDQIYKNACSSGFSPLYIKVELKFLVKAPPIIDCYLTIASNDPFNIFTDEAYNFSLIDQLIKTIVRSINGKINYNFSSNSGIEIVFPIKRADYFP